MITNTTGYYEELANNDIWFLTSRIAAVFSASSGILCNVLIWYMILTQNQARKNSCFISQTVCLVFEGLKTAAFFYTELCTEEIWQDEGGLYQKSSCKEARGTLASTAAFLLYLVCATMTFGTILNS